MVYVLMTHITSDRSGCVRQKPLKFRMLKNRHMVVLSTPLPPLVDHEWYHSITIPPKLPVNFYYEIRGSSTGYFVCLQSPPPHIQMKKTDQVSILE